MIYWWVDRRNCIVVRGRRAVRLGFLQFAIFDALHRQRLDKTKSMRADDLADKIYNGAANPSTRATVHTCVNVMNRKLAHLGLKVRGVNRKQNSFYQIVAL